MSVSPFTEHPCLPLPTPEELQAILRVHGDKAPDVLQELERRRLETIAKAEADPFRHGWELECWRDADALLAMPETRLVANLGGNGSAKSWWMIKRGVQTAFKIPGSRILLLHEDEDASRDQHQALAYHFLPPEIKPSDTRKQVKTRVTTDISYTAKNGFTGNAFTTPNGSRVRFGFYRQDLKRYEGGGYTFIGADENMPLSWLETLLFRLGRAGGKFVWCFTAIRGITPAVAAVTKGARTLRSRPADPDILPANHRVDEIQDWPEGEMPYIQQGTKPEVKVIFFHSDQNPLAGYDPSQGRGAFYGYNDLKTFLRDKPTPERERRAYGWTRKSSRTVFPLFGAVHVIEEKAMAAQLAKLPVTRYQIVDPAGARHFFMIWFAVDKHGRHFIYREWPDVTTYGEWALPSDDPNKWDGKQGPAQEKTISGVVAYKRIMLEAEGWTYKDGVWCPARDIAGQGSTGTRPAEEIFDRYVDPRSGATESMASEAGESSVLDRFRQEQTDDQGHIVGPSLLLTPAISGKTEEDGLTQIDELLAYNPREPITALINEPKLFISSACESTIWALNNYTAHDGSKAACKDPVDAVRYLALKQCIHVDMKLMGGVKGGGW